MQTRKLTLAKAGRNLHLSIHTKKSTIRMRDYKNTEAFAGMFSQIGELYNVKVNSTQLLPLAVHCTMSKVNNKLK